LARLLREVLGKLRIEVRFKDILVGNAIIDLLKMMDFSE